MKQLKCNIVNNRLYNKINNKKYYSTNSFVNNNINIFYRLKEIIKELGLNPIYVFENLNLENIKKQVLNNTKGLSGIYMIVNKITKDYYVGSAATNRFYYRFSNHLIYF